MSHLPSTIRALAALLTMSAVALAGCSASTASTAPSLALASLPAVSSAVPTESASAAPAESAPAAASETPQPTAVATDIDPCQLVTTDEASALAGATLAKGTVSTQNNNRICSYGAEGIVLQVLVSVAPDAATAKAQEPAFKADLEQGAAQAGMANPKLTEITDFEPGVDAAVISGGATVSGMKVAAIALYALKGAVLVAISDIAIGGSVASSDAIKAQAHTTLARLP